MAEAELAGLKRKYTILLDALRTCFKIHSINRSAYGSLMDSLLLLTTPYLRLPIERKSEA